MIEAVTTDSMTGPSPNSVVMSETPKARLVKS
jgi:hypothetical protein